MICLIPSFEPIVFHFYLQRSNAGQRLMISSLLPPQLMGDSQEECGPWNIGNNVHTALRHGQATDRWSHLMGAMGDSIRMIDQMAKILFSIVLYNIVLRKFVILAEDAALRVALPFDHHYWP